MRAGTPTGGDGESSAVRKAPEAGSAHPHVPAQRTEPEQALNAQVGEEELRKLLPAISAQIRGSGIGEQHRSDIAQEAVYRILKARKKGTVRSYTADAEGRAFARHSTRLAIFDFLRAQYRDRERYVFVPEFEETGIPEVDEELVTLEELYGFVVKHVLDDELERTVFLLKTMAKLTVTDIADLLGMDRGTARRKFNKAKQQLKDASKDNLM